MSSTAKSSYSLSPLKDAFSSLLSNSGNGSRDVGLGIPTAATETSPVLGYRPKSSLSSSLKPPPTASESASAVNPRTRPASSSSSYQQRTTRPLSEIIRPESFVSPETEALDRWYEDLQDYERNLESMASASLDAHFKDELQHVEQWFTYLNEAERTATVYTLLQHSSPVQIRFFITVLQQMGKRDPLGSLLSPAYPEKADMQAQLSGAMLKAEFEASQRLMSVLPYHRTPRQQQGQQQQQQRRQISNTVKGSSNIDRHSFALGEADEHRLFGSLGLSAASSNAFGLNMEDTAFMSRQSRLKPQARSPMFGSNNAARPRSVIEGDLSSIFGNSGWSFNPSSGGMVGAMDAHRTSTGRPKSADISNWSFGLQSGDPAAAAIGSSWGGLSPTLSTFSERGKTIERPSSASDADQHLNVLGNPWSPKVVLSNNNDDNNAKNFSRRGASIPGTVPETDERQQQVADIVFSMYDDNKPIPQKSTSTHSVNRRKTSRNASPIPTASNSASLAPYWDKSPKTRGGQQYGRFLNPNDIMPEGDHDYLSDHSDASNISNRNHNNHHSRHGNGKKRIFGGQRSSNKEKKYSDVVDMKLLEDIPAWLRNLRLHKYNPIFEKMKWQDMIKLDDEALAAKGVAALGARRKMLKVFEQVKQHCDTNNIPY